MRGSVAKVLRGKARNFSVTPLSYGYKRVEKLIRVVNPKTFETEWVNATRYIKVLGHCQRMGYQELKKAYKRGLVDANLLILQSAVGILDELKRL